MVGHTLSHLILGGVVPMAAALPTLLSSPSEARHALQDCTQTPPSPPQPWLDCGSLLYKNKLVWTLTLEEWECLNFKGSFWEPFEPHLQSPCRELHGDSFMAPGAAASSQAGCVYLSSQKLTLVPSCPSTLSRSLEIRRFGLGLDRWMGLGAWLYLRFIWRLELILLLWESVYWLMECLLELSEQIKHTYISINPPIPLPNHCLVKLILFPALTSCQLVILPGHIKFHRVWVYWLGSEVYVVTEISLDGQGYSQGDQESSVDSCCWHGLDVRVPGALSKKNQSWLFAAANECNKTLLRDRSLDVIASCPVPFPPICQPASLHNPPVPKSSPHHEGGTWRPEVKPLSSTFRG